MSCEKRGEGFQIDGACSSNELAVDHLDEILWSLCGVECDYDMSVGVPEQLLEKWSCDRDGGNVVKNDQDVWCGHQRSC